MSLFLFTSICLIFISSCNAVNLDNKCDNQTQCSGTGAICQDKICQCKTPFYTPCQTSECYLTKAFAYKGDACRVDANCLSNMICKKPEYQCGCLMNYTAINGLCYKSLNARCTTELECWPRACRDGICKCPLGFVFSNDQNRCRRKFAGLYVNWTEANAATDFCYDVDQYPCAVASAVCRNDSQRPEKFCQCPTSHTNYENQKCELKIYNGLSPSESQLSLEACGKCQVDYAICAAVSNQTTCWCQAGFSKMDGKCVQDRQTFIFPNRKDIDRHDYTWNCPMNGTNGLCACAPGYRYVNQAALCQPIEYEWSNDQFEYGVCTRIDSNGRPMQDSGLCPARLNCEPRKDKYVCSCGHHKYFDTMINSCRYFLERNLTTIDGAFCPLNSIFQDDKCQCNPPGIFRVSKDNQHCELILNRTGDSEETPVCNASISGGNDSCVRFFGGNARFCREGECRCMLRHSYPSNNTCITLIHSNPGSHVSCPVNAESSNNLCLCKTGYVEHSDNRTCVRKVNHLNETITSVQNFTSILTLEDCQALFPNQSVRILNNACECEKEGFYNGTICVSYLGYGLPNSPIQCPIDANGISGICQCNTGYKEVNNRTCAKKTMNVYSHNQLMEEVIPELTLADCQALFGPAASVSENSSFCRCGDANLIFHHSNQCYYFIDTDLGNINPDSACPPTSTKNGHRCICPTGYAVNSSRTNCVRKSLSLSNLLSIDMNSMCSSSYTDADCEVLYGPGAVCRNGSCYCDRSRSFFRNNSCEPLSKIVFPGAHEYHGYTCDSIDDCGKEAENKGIECDFLDENYRVCQCKRGYSFNPINSSCVVNQCFPSCSSTEECEDTQCICQVGYYRDASEQCVKFDVPLILHNRCNRTYWNTLRPDQEELQCSPDCERFTCSKGYRDDGSKCIKNTFTDRCVHEESICASLSPYSQCDKEENTCVCSPDFYPTKGSRICARAVGLSCTDAMECGELGDCLNRICGCKRDGMEREGVDSLGRTIRTCIQVSSGDSLRINLVYSFFFVVLVRLFFA